MTSARRPVGPNSTQIHPTAIVDDGADIHPSVRIGPYSIIESGVTIAEDSVIESSVRIHRGTHLGRCNRVFHGAVLGGDSQDLGFDDDRARPLTIGDGNLFREYVTVSRGIKSERGTRIGNGNYFMAYSHAGHDCIVGDRNVLANTATLAGHAEMENHCFISGQVAVHQFCRIGSYTMLGGLSGISKDVPPYVIANGQRAAIIGLNLVGLKRNGFDQQRRQHIKSVYRFIFRSGRRLEEALIEAEQRFPDADTDAIVRFIRGSSRGVMGFS